MTISDSILGFSDCLDVMDKALGDPIGVRIRFDTKGEAVFFRMRLHTARSLTRKQNRKVYAEKPEHPLYGKSLYDRLIAKVREEDGSWFVRLEQVTADNLDIQSLSRPEPEEPEPSPSPTDSSRRF